MQLSPSFSENRKTQSSPAKNKVVNSHLDMVLRAPPVLLLGAKHIIRPRSVRNKGFGWWGWWPWMSSSSNSSEDV